MKKAIAIAAILMSFAAPGVADEAHHPDEQQAQASTPQTPPTQPGPAVMGQGMGQGMQGMMGSGQGMMGPGMMAGGMMMNCPMTGMMGPGNSYTEGRLAFLKAELKISGQQERTWSSYAEAVRGIDKNMAGMMGNVGPGMMMQQGNQVSAPDAMKARISMMENRLKNMKTLQSATTKLYGALNDEQKQTADQLLGCGMGMM